ncbi:hypothetical protein BDW02DRAFT_496109 [Decorospora gaudefroyi]|uniref:Rhodopsin domain-containing protein n=1 Tax=Decorospora gaudefroyi TaxID=184978 RepID=A0A6A5KBS1_9PLEO|nr:hypothetical protein BDW02DRAFT_496109 [Decorospora gaudefroyi]
MQDSPEFLAENRGPTVTAAASVMIFFCTTFVALRYYSRYLTSTAFSVEDAIIPFAWLAEIGLCISGIVMTEKAGTGRHMAWVVTTDPSMVSEHFKGIMVQEILHPAAVAFPKLTVALLYLHILTNKWERLAAKTLVIVIFATWISFSVAIMFQCMPFAFNWDKSIPNGRCFNVQVFANSSSVPNIATDLAMLLLPLRTVWRLKISVARRIGLLLIFLTGSVGIIASVIRTIVFAQTLAKAGPLTDVTWNHVSLINWTIIEPGMYLLSACALSFKPLFRLLAKVLHLHAFITHSRSTFGAGGANGANGKSIVKKSNTFGTGATAQTQSQRGLELGTFARLSEDSEVTGCSSETGACPGGRVMVTKTIELVSEEKSGDGDADWMRREPVRVEFGKGV